MVAVLAILAWSSRFKSTPCPFWRTDHRALSSPLCSLTFSPSLFCTCAAGLFRIEMSRSHRHVSGKCVWQRREKDGREVPGRRKRPPKQTWPAYPKVQNQRKIPPMTAIPARAEPSCISPILTLQRFGFAKAYSSYSCHFKPARCIKYGTKVSALRTDRAPTDGAERGCSPCRCEHDETRRLSSYLVGAC